MSVVIGLSLALGVGSNTAIFSLARAIVFKPTPYRDADRVVLVEPYLRHVPTQISGAAHAAAPRREGAEPR
jgi:hypothetical protein